MKTRLVVSVRVKDVHRKSCQVRSALCYQALVAGGKISTEIFIYKKPSFLRIKAVYDEGVMNRMNVFKWCRGRTNVHDDQRSGRPSILRPPCFGTKKESNSDRISASGGYD